MASDNANAFTCIVKELCSLWSPFSQRRNGESKNSVTLLFGNGPMVG